MQTESAAGFYGKLPCKGDFLQRRVSQEFVDGWDTWLQQCLFVSREQLQDRWLDAYLTSPVWRFVLGEGVCGSGAYAGVMLPSVDRVGRYFPLTLIAQLNTEDCLLEVAGDDGRQWFDSAEALALGALQAHDLDLVAFDEQVAALTGPVGGPQAAESAQLRGLMGNSQFARRPGQWQVPLSTVHSVQRAANVFASRELERTLRPLALWWTAGSDVVAPCWLCNRGLPSPSSFAALLAGGWERFGWESLGLATAVGPAWTSAAAGSASTPDVADPAGMPDATGSAPTPDAANPAWAPSAIGSARAPDAADQAWTSAPATGPPRTSATADPARTPASAAGPTWRPAPAGSARAIGPAASALELNSQPVAITVRHGAITRGPGSPPRIYFISRPDQRLWGVSCSAGHDPGGASIAQSMADVLHDIPTAGSLSSLVEEVRRALEAVRNQPPGPASGTTVAEIGAVVFLSRSNECAVVCAGPAQAVRLRASEVTVIEGELQSVQSDGDPLQLPRTAARGSLLDLLTAPAPAPSAEPVVAHYDTLMSGDVWLLAGARLFDDPQLARLPVLLARRFVDDAQTGADAALAAVQRLSGGDSGFNDRELPLMLLAAASSAADLR